MVEVVQSIPNKLQRIEILFINHSSEINDVFKFTEYISFSGVNKSKIVICYNNLVHGYVSN